MAASIVTWSRLEPVDQSSDLSVSLAAPIADPLWMLHRQWQFGELEGNDAGTPIEVRIEQRAVPLSRVRLGDDGAVDPVDYAPTDLPLEPVVEAERVRGVTGGHRRLAAETGAQLARMLRAADLESVAAGLREGEFRLVVPPSLDPIADPLGAEAAVLLSGRAVDGDAVAAALAPHRGSDGGLSGLPSSIPGDHATVRPVVERWLAWYDELLIEPAAGGASAAPAAWDPRRLEHRFASAAGGVADQVTFVASAFDDGHLDWPDLDVDSSVDLGASTTPVSTVTRFDAVIPVPLRYPGMPAHRHWELEDGRVNFASVQAGSTDIVRILLTDFALVYGEDWFVLPLEVPVGSVVTITSMRVRDTFGVVSDVEPTVGPETNPFQRPWSMYRTSAVTGDPLDLDTLFVPPTLGMKTAGPPIEEVAFFRDEMANVVWAVERTTPSPLGTAVDRYRNSQPASVARVPVDVTELGDAELVYRLATPVPSNWYPYLPRRTPAGDDITLERLPASDPEGSIATESMVLEDEEVSRGGVVVSRAWQYARWIDGRPLLWLGRHTRPGHGEGSSGLAWDTTESPR